MFRDLLLLVVVLQCGGVVMAAGSYPLPFFGDFPGNHCFVYVVRMDHTAYSLGRQYGRWMRVTPAHEISLIHERTVVESVLLQRCAPDYVWSQAGWGLPHGLVITPEGIVTGMPATAGTYTFRVRVRDQRADSTETNLTLEVEARGTGPAGVIGHGVLGHGRIGD